MKLAAYQFKMSPWASSVRKDSSVGFWMIQVALVVSALGLSAVSKAQAIGTSQTSANAMSTPRQIPLNSLVRRSIEACGDGRAGVALVGSSWSEPPVPGGGS